jgi:hypothetical protein
MDYLIFKGDRVKPTPPEIFRFEGQGSKIKRTYWLICASIASMVFGERAASMAAEIWFAGLPPRSITVKLAHSVEAA